MKEIQSQKADPNKLYLLYYNSFTVKNISIIQVNEGPEFTPIVRMLSHKDLFGNFMANVFEVINVDKYTDSSFLKESVLHDNYTLFELTDEETHLLIAEFL